LALIYACSAVGAGIGAGELPTLDKSAADWACRLSEYLTRRLVYTAGEYVAENPFDDVQQRIIRELRKAGGELTQSSLTRSLQRIPPRLKQEAITNLQEVGRLRFKQIETTGRTKGLWWLAW
jgi:hypothetical protein